MDGQIVIDCLFLSSFIFLPNLIFGSVLHGSGLRSSILVQTLCSLFNLVIFFTVQSFVWTFGLSFVYTLVESLVRSFV